MQGTLVYLDATRVKDPEILDDGDRLARLVEHACTLGGATVRRVVIERFEPQGVTVAAVLAESHATLHTYPETAGYMLDVFTCGDKADPQAIVTLIAGILGGHIWTRVVDRGHRGAEEEKKEGGQEEGRKEEPRRTTATVDAGDVYSGD